MAKVGRRVGKKDGDMKEVKEMIKREAAKKIRNDHQSGCKVEEMMKDVVNDQPKVQK